jgi:uroporphyrin-III C-methyltransferase / precorrin-2 dehydrogenase / sirohydrochlorin ferrochelatase
MAQIGSLPLFHRVRGTHVVVVSEGTMGDAKRRLVERAGGLPCSEAEAHLAQLAFVALNDPREAEVVALRLKRRGLLVNVADQPDLCDFTLPSILDREPVLVAVSTSGASAGLAKQLRLRLERLLPPSLGPLAQALAEAREAMRSRWPDGADRRRALDAALQEGAALDPLDPAAPGRIDIWLTDTVSEPAPTHHIITLSSNDPDDLTLRQARLLGEADTIVHDPGVAPAILARARADAARHMLPFSGDAPGLVVELRL